jgi:hypothetical protein
VEPSIAAVLERVRTASVGDPAELAAELRRTFAARTAAIEARLRALETPTGGLPLLAADLEQRWRGRGVRLPVRRLPLLGALLCLAAAIAFTTGFWLGNPAGR